MSHQQAAAIGGEVLRLGHQLDAAEIVAKVGAGKFVVVAGNIDHPAALARTTKQFLHHIVVTLWPEPASAQLPAIHDVADQIQSFAGMLFQEIQQCVRLETRRTDVQVRDENRSVTRLVFVINLWLFIRSPAKSS